MSRPEWRKVLHIEDWTSDNSPELKEEVRVTLRIPNKKPTEVYKTSISDSKKNTITSYRVYQVRFACDNHPHIKEMKFGRCDQSEKNFESEYRFSVRVEVQKNHRASTAFFKEWRAAFREEMGRFRIFKIPQKNSSHIAVYNTKWHVVGSLYGVRDAYSFINAIHRFVPTNTPQMRADLDVVLRCLPRHPPTNRMLAFNSETKKCDFDLRKNPASDSDVVSYPLLPIHSVVVRKGIPELLSEDVSPAISPELI